MGGFGSASVLQHGGFFPILADGRAIRPEQPDPENAELPGRRGPPETVPEEVRKLWDLLP